MIHNIDLLLINPGIFSGIRTYGQMLHEPTMGLYVIREYLLNRGFIVEIIDGIIQTIDEKGLLEKAQISKVIGFYGVYTNMMAIKKLSSVIKHNNNKSIIVIGGPNWPAGKEILNDYPNIDIIIKDNSENTIENILTQLRKNDMLLPETIKGIFFRFGNQIVDTGNNNNLSIPSKPISIKFDVPSINKSILKLITVKGCPNSCSFCFHSKWQELITIEDLVSIMENAFTKGINTFYIADENFCPPKMSYRINQMCKLLKNSSQLKKRQINLKLFIEPFTSLKILNDINQLAQITAFIGFESFSDKTLAFLGKNTNRRNNLQFWSKSKSIGINIIPGIISLHPFVTPNDIIDLINDLSFFYAFSWRNLLKKLDLYPGTVILSKMISKYPNLLMNNFCSFLRPSNWNYNFDKKSGKPVMLKIEKVFKTIAEQEVVQELYELTFDLNIIQNSKNKKTLSKYHSIQSDFIIHSKKIALELITTITNNPNVNLKTLPRSSVSQYLNEVNSILKSTKTLYNHIDKDDFFKISKISTVPMRNI